MFGKKEEAKVPDQVVNLNVPGLQCQAFYRLPATLTCVWVWLKLKQFKAKPLTNINLCFFEVEQLKRILVVVVVFISLMTQVHRTSAQSDKDTTKVEQREFLKLLKDAEELNEEQKQRAKRTINPRILNRLAQDEDPGVRFYVGFNPWTPQAALLQLCKDANETVRWAVAMNSRQLFQIDPKFQDNLDNSSLSMDMEKVFGTRGAPLASDAEIEIVQSGKQWNVISNGMDLVVRKTDGILNVFQERLPLQVLLDLSKDFVEIVRMGLAANPNMPPEILQRLAADISVSVRKKVAGNLNTEPFILELLSRDARKEVRLEVSGNPHTPLRVMERFSTEGEEAFRLSVAGNRGTSPVILLGLIFDTSLPVRQAVAAHVSMPASGLLRLAEDADPQVKLATVQNPNTPAEALKILSFNKDKNIKEIARNRLARILKAQISRDRER
ncbi:MAG: hypothetical protein CME25_00715 [Gemmatimonadetes bacterium]|nr:hypothetical protein [Gemmatimonadota bacterium]